MEIRFCRSTVTEERISVERGKLTPCINTQLNSMFAYSFVDILLGFGYFSYLKIATLPSLVLPGLMGD